MRVKDSQKHASAVGKMQSSRKRERSGYRHEKCVKPFEPMTWVRRGVARSGGCVVWHKVDLGGGVSCLARKVDGKTIVKEGSLRYGS